MTDSEKYKGTFYGAPVDFRDEYVQARKLMGTVGTDLDKILETVGFLYLYCHEDLAPVYRALMEEIQMRQDILARTELKIDV